MPDAAADSDRHLLPSPSHRHLPPRNLMRFQPDRTLELLRPDSSSVSIGYTVPSWIPADRR